MDERLRPVERIRKKKDFIELYRKGRRLRGRYFHLVFQPNGLEYSRLGVVVSRKIGQATARNRVKRLFRELFRKNKNLLPGPVDLIFIAQPDICGRTRDEVAAEFRAVLERLAL
ncbi:MAG: ribonuclease P protein component [Candidatus Saccharicenans sp.]|jgi:ribonuclease P protein component|nr:ribonuclease P protein component [Candidatus Saccharicenans sp.]MDH7492369.1 ribonuclease P protein component [Candidatus Saccharicenans sp.]